MTTLVALSTKDAVVMGCDSLATSSKLLVDPFELASCFDPGNEWKIRTGANGEPAIRDLWQIVDLSRSVPYYHMTDIDKLLDLSPLPMGVMFTGITSIGTRTIKSLISEFKDSDKSAFPKKSRPKNYTVRSVSTRLMTHLLSYYEKQYANTPPRARPALELLVAGYDRSSPLPSIFRVDLQSKSARPAIDGPGIAFGGQMNEIQRIVFGVDARGIFLLERQYKARLREFSRQVEELNGVQVNAPDIDAFGDKYQLFGRADPDDPNSDAFELPALVANWGDFSEQNAIDCVAYFIGVMREAQRFGSSMPTVGGSIHVALIHREGGFKFISREEYRHEDHRVQRRALDGSPG